MSKKNKFNKKLPKFKSHKVIQALVIAEAVRTMKGTATLHFEKEEKALPFEPIEVNDAFVRKHSPKAGDVYVIYEDGYVSISPIKAFEDGYVLLDGKESNAEDQLKDAKSKLTEREEALKAKETELEDREKIVSEKEAELAKDIDVDSSDVDQTQKKD